MTTSFFTNSEVACLDALRHQGRCCYSMRAGIYRMYRVTLPYTASFLGHMACAVSPPQVLFIPPVRDACSRGAIEIVDGLRQASMGDKRLIIYVCKSANVRFLGVSLGAGPCLEDIRDLYATEPNMRDLFNDVLEDDFAQGFWVTIYTVPTSTLLNHLWRFSRLPRSLPRHCRRPRTIFLRLCRGESDESVQLIAPFHTNGFSTPL